MSSRRLTHFVLIALVSVLGAALCAVAVRSSAQEKAVTLVSRMDAAPDTSSLHPLLPPTVRTPHITRKPTKKARTIPTDPWERYGYDISWPQCGPYGPALPPARGASAIVGITGGRPFTVNPCLGNHWAWAKSRAHHSAYINLAFPPNGMDPAGYGAATVWAALREARAAGLTLSGVWLDVEIGNHWSRNQEANNVVVWSAIAALQAAHIQPGLYSTPVNWSLITGNARILVPLWLAVYDPNEMTRSCSGPGIGGRSPDMVQAVISEGGSERDWNLRCTVRPDFLRALG